MTELNLRNQFIKASEELGADDAILDGKKYLVVSANDSYIDDNMVYEYAISEGKDDSNVYKVNFDTVDGWEDIDDADSWVEDWSKPESVEVAFEGDDEALDFAMQAGIITKDQYLEWN